MLFFIISLLESLLGNPGSRTHRAFPRDSRDDHESFINDIDCYCFYEEEPTDRCED